MLFVGIRFGEKILNTSDTEKQVWRRKVSYVGWLIQSYLTVTQFIMFKNIIVFANSYICKLIMSLGQPCVPLPVLKGSTKLPTLLLFVLIHDNKLCSMQLFFLNKHYRPNCWQRWLQHILILKRSS